MTALTQRARQLLGDWPLSLGLIVAVLFITLGVVWPLARMVTLSLSAEGLSLFADFVLRPNIRRIMLNTVLLGLLVAGTGTLLAFVFAFVQVFLDVPLKRFMHLMALIPIISPPFAVAMAVVTLFGRSGLISYRLLGIRYDIYGLDGLTLVLALSFFPVAYLNLVGMMRALDPSLDEAAVNMGASRWHVLRTVTVPMLLPGLLSAFLLLFVESIADLGNPLVIGGDYTVLATRVYIAILGDYDLVSGAVLSVLLLVPSLAVFVVQRSILGGRSFVSVTGKPTGQARAITTPWVKWPLFGAALGVALLIALIYGTVLLGAFTKLIGINNALTLDNFRFVLFGYGTEAIWDTTLFALVAMPVATLIGMLVAYLVVRRRFIGRGLLDFAALLGIAVPGTVLGIGYVLAYNQDVSVGGATLLPRLVGGAGLWGGGLAIVLAYAARAMPASVRNGAAALQQIDPALEEASRNLGADSAATFRRVTLPLVRPALLAGLIFAFARSMTSLSSIIFLTTPSTRIMVAQVFNEADAGRFGNAFAYCVILIAIVLAAIGALYALVGSTTGSERALDVRG